VWATDGQPRWAPIFPASRSTPTRLTTFLRATLRSEVTAGLAVVAAAVMGLAVSAAVAYLSASWSLVAAAAMICGYFAFAQYLLVADGLLVGVLFPITTAFITYAGLAAYRYICEERENRVLRHAVGER
jgi:hypothetical protein